MENKTQLSTELDFSFAVGLAKDAGHTLLEHFRSARFETRLKADRSIVTQVDIEVDQLIKEEIQAHYPNDILLSEELQPNYNLDTQGKARGVWVIDPLDGTTNFSLGLHFWGVLLSRVLNGWPEIAVCYFPLIDELYTAQKGKGAKLNGESIQVQPPAPERPLSFFACCSRTFQRYEVSVRYKARILGSAGYTFCTVARGIALLGFESTPKIWDISAAWLLVTEAGGVIETLDGSQPFPLKIGLEYAQLNFPTLAAATPELALRARQQILPKSTS